MRNETKAACGWLSQAMKGTHSIVDRIPRCALYIIGFEETTAPQHPNDVNHFFSKVSLIKLPLIVDGGKGRILSQGTPLRFGEARHVRTSACAAHRLRFVAREEFAATLIPLELSFAGIPYARSSIFSVDRRERDRGSRA